MGRGTDDASSRPIQVAVSACLLGQNVRYDGGHQHDPLVTETLGRFFQLVAFCPEVESGLSVPRSRLRLQRQGSDVRLVMPETGRHLTRRMRSRAKARVAGLAEDGVSGCLLKSRSPSCGLRVRTFTPKGRPAKWTSGQFAQVLQDSLPNLPVIEDGLLHDIRLRENWIERVFAYRRLGELWSSRWKIAELVAFHTANKYVLLAHSPAAYQEIGRLLAAAESLPRKQLRQRYESQFMAALTKPATLTRHARVLRQMFRFFQQDLDATSREEVLQGIQAYRRQLVPLLAPLTLVRHYVRLLEVTPLSGQVYLNPHPSELALRYHA